MLRVIETAISVKSAQLSEEPLTVSHSSYTSVFNLSNTPAAPALIYE